MQVQGLYHPEILRLLNQAELLVKDSNIMSG
jgi:hypothetical protein